MIKCICAVLAVIGFILLPPLANFELPYKDALSEWAPLALGVFILSVCILSFTGRIVEHENNQKKG